MTKISDLTALTGAGVDTATDLFPIVDMSAAGAARNKKITVAETRIGLGLSSADSPQFTAINLGHASDTTITRASAGVVAIEGVNIVTTAGGVTFAADIVVPDEAYDATAWNGSLEVPTKNAVRDKIESLAGGVTDLDDLADVNAPTPSNGDVLTWDSTPGEWVSAAPSGGIAELDDVPDVNAPTPSNGDVLTWDSTPGEWVASAPSGGGTPSGTSFPGSPSTDDLFYRTDRRIEYFYDGTRWLSTQIHTLDMPFALAAAPSADQSFYSAIPFKGTYDIYLETLYVSGWRSAAGEWDFLFQHATGTGTYTTIITVDGSGHPTTTWFAGSTAHNAVLTSSCEALRLTLDEISGSASLIGAACLTYRLVG